MADCFEADVDDLHRRWLPQEIFADTGIPDTVPPSAAAIEDVAVHITGIVGGKEVPPPPPPGLTAHHQHYRQQPTQVCGQQGTVLLAYDGGCIGGAVSAPWLLLPYQPLQWQVTTDFAIGGGFMGPAHPPLQLSHGSPQEKRHAVGTGVFLPRTQVQQYQQKAANKTPAKAKEKQSQRQGSGEEATKTVAQQQSVSTALLALPQEWTY